MKEDFDGNSRTVKGGVLWPCRMAGFWDVAVRSFGQWRV